MRIAVYGTGGMAKQLVNILKVNRGGGASTLYIL